MLAHKISKITIVFLRYQKEELDSIRKQLLEVIQMYIEKEGQFYITIARGRARIIEL
jgi:septum formation topological specificity factor MinE